MSSTHQQQQQQYASYANPPTTSSSVANPMLTQPSPLRPYDLHSNHHAGTPPPPSNQVTAPAMSSAPFAPGYAPHVEPSSSAAAYNPFPLAPAVHASPRTSPSPYARSPIASPQPSSVHQHQSATSPHITYDRSSLIGSPPPASQLVTNAHAGLSSPPPAGSATSTGAQRNVSIAARSGITANTNTTASRSASAKQSGSPSISKSSRSGASKLIGEPDSVIRVPTRFAGAYIAAIAAEAAIIITLVGIVFARIITSVDHFSQDLKTVSVYLAVFVFGCVFQAMVAWDAVRLKNTFQLIGVLIFNIALTVTAVLEIRQVKGALEAQDQKEGLIPCPDNPNQFCLPKEALYPTVRVFLIAVAAVCGFFEIVIALLSFKLWKEFGWTIYQKIGADLKIRNMFFWYQLFIVFLKFAFFFGVGFTVIYLILVAQVTNWEYAVTIAAVPIAMVALFTAGFAVRREWTSLMTLSLLCMIAGLVYFVYKLTQVWLPATRDQYTYVNKTITFISGFAILCLALTLINGIICLLNFNKGLKPAHDSIGIFGGVRTHRKRGASEGKNLDTETNNEPKRAAVLEDDDDDDHTTMANGHTHRPSVVGRPFPASGPHMNGGGAAPYLAHPHPVPAMAFPPNSVPVHAGSTPVMPPHMHAVSPPPQMHAVSPPPSTISHPGAHAQAGISPFPMSTQSPPPQQIAASQIIHPDHQPYAYQHQPRPSNTRISLD